MILRMTVRERAVALVAGLGALGGFIAGATGALLAVAVLTPSAPVTLVDKAAMVLSYGAVAAASGAVLGTGLAFAMLRRVRLGRILACGTAGAALGLTYGFLGGPWAWHHFTWLGVGGLAAGMLAARFLGHEPGEGGTEGALANWVGAGAADSDPSAALEPGAKTPDRAAPEREPELVRRKPGPQVPPSPG